MPLVPLPTQVEIAVAIEIAERGSRVAPPTSWPFSGFAAPVRATNAGLVALPVFSK